MMELWPFTNFHDLNLDWIIREIKKLRKEMDDFFFDLKKYVLDLLSDHPEWIQDWMLDDGTVTKPKFDVTTWNLVDNAYTNAKVYGVVGDGVTDDTDAIQDAVDNVTGVLWFPAGTYKITKPILVSRNCLTIKGNGINATKIYKEGSGGYGPLVFGIDSRTYDWSNLDSIFIFAPPNGYSGTDRSQVVSIENMSLERSNPTDANTYAMYGTNLAYSKFENVRAIYGDTALHLEYSFANKFNGVEFLGTNDDTVQLDNVTSTVFNQCFFRGVRDRCVETVNSSAMFNNCAFDNGMIRAQNDSKLSFTNCRTESDEAVFVAINSVINAAECNIERHKTAANNETIGYFRANGGTISVKNSVVRWQNYTTYPDPANQRLYEAWNNGNVVIEAVFEDVPSMTYQCSTGSTAEIKHLEPGADVNPWYPEIGTFTPNAALTVDNANSFISVREYGSRVEIDLQLHITAGSPAADTEATLGTIAGVTMPPVLWREYGMCGWASYAATNPSYISISTSGEIKYRTSSASNAYLNYHITYPVDGYMI